MTISISRNRIEYGDFQTPLELAEQVCQKLLDLGINPSIVIEPTCGTGNFIEAAINSFSAADRVVAVEVNLEYFQTLDKKDQFKDKKVEIKHGNFFDLDWSSLIDDREDNILVLGNFPWVTNSRQGTIGGSNLPSKSNFQNHSGFDAVTGKSNFDISEWMLIKTIEWLQHHNHSHLAMLCKASVARKLLNYMHLEKINLDYCATYRIDAKQYFNASVEACLLLCQFKQCSQNYSCDVFNSFEDQNPYKIRYHNEILVKNPAVFEGLSHLHNPNTGTKWRSGIKHDCSNVMEFFKEDVTYTNGLGESVELEETYLFPLIKGSDVAQNRIDTTHRYVLVPQKCIGEPTDSVRETAPKTWNYLEAHGDYLDRRKSKIYQQNPRFSIFGVGSYTFAPWKIAICGLYKKLEFRLVGQINEKPVVFDDTVYFLSFEDEQAARETLHFLTSPFALDFYSCLIFWDEKRPIKSSILNALNLEALAEILEVRKR